MVLFQTKFANLQDLVQTLEIKQRRGKQLKWPMWFFVMLMQSNSEPMSLPVKNKDYQQLMRMQVTDRLSTLWYYFKPSFQDLVQTLEIKQRRGKQLNDQCYFIKCWCRVILKPCHCQLKIKIINNWCGCMSLTDSVHCGTISNQICKFAGFGTNSGNQTSQRETA